MIEKTQHNVEFNNTSSSNLSLQLDNDNNVENNFHLGSLCYFDVFTSSPLVLLTSTTGSLTLFKSGEEKTIVEYITFINKKTSSVSYPVKSLISATWFGNSLGALKLLDDTTFACDALGVGVVRVVYKTSYDIHILKIPSTLSLIPEEDGKIVIYAINEDGEEAGLTIDVKGDIFSDKDIVIVAKDYDLDLALPNSSVFVDGTYMGVTNADGKINLGKIKLGMHNLVIQKEGYKDTDKDALNNDFFVVE